MMVVMRAELPKGVNWGLSDFGRLAGPRKRTYGLLAVYKSLRPANYRWVFVVCGGKGA